MKTARNRVAAIIITFFLIGASTAYSSGIPALDAAVMGTTKLIIVTKYDSASYTYAQAEAFSQTVTKLLGSVSTLTGSNGIAIGHYPPSQVASWGITDADTLKSLVKTYYKSWGFTLYAFIDIKRITSTTAPALGPTMRIDIWVADLAALLKQTGDYLYIASFEIPEAYLTLLGSSF